MLIFVQILQKTTKCVIITEGEQIMREMLFRGKRADNEECAGIAKEAEV